MAKRSKAKKQARVDHTLELIRRHEPEEDQIMKALGEERNARDDLADRVRRDYQPGFWRGFRSYYGISGDWGRPDPLLWINPQTLRGIIEMDWPEAKDATFKRHFIDQHFRVTEEPKYFTVLDEPEGRDNGGHVARDVSHLLQPRFTWSADGDEEGS